MHEFSLAGEVVKLAEHEARLNDALSVSEITIEVGNLSGVEAEAFESALRILSEKSLLADALINIVRIRGKGICLSCRKEFDMETRIDTCPDCHEFPSQVNGGHEFRVLSILIEKE